MSEWTHAICDECWTAKTAAEGESGRGPHRMFDPETEVCCFCLSDTRSGIFVRADPETTRCKGKHAD